MRLSVPEDRGFARETTHGKRDSLRHRRGSVTKGLHLFRSGAESQAVRRWTVRRGGTCRRAGGRPLPGQGGAFAKSGKSLTQQSGEPMTSSPATISAAAELGGLGIDLPAAVRQSVQQVIDEFLQNELRSKPIAFYTWNGDLSAIFQQDRMLQTELKDKVGTEALVKALHAAGRPGPPTEPIWPWFPD